MSEKQDLQDFICNIQKGLKTFTIKEFSDAISCALTHKEQWSLDNNKQVGLILDLVCKEYKISRHQLIYSKLRGTINHAKMVACCLLHFELSLPIRYISTRIFFLKWHNPVGVAIRYKKNLNLSIKIHKEFNDNYNKIKNEVLQEAKLNLTTK